MNSLNDILDDMQAAGSPPATQKQSVDFNELKNTVYQIKDQLEGILRLINKQQTASRNQSQPDINFLDSGERVIEGVFNGYGMVGQDGKEYSVPPNYASKSKLVEGDMMKLTITDSGSFIYKQIGPIERKRLVGELMIDGEQYNVLADGRTYRALTAAVTFFKGKSGDEAVILVPRDSNSNWAAVENIIRK